MKRNYILLRKNWLGWRKTLVRKTMIPYSWGTIGKRNVIGWNLAPNGTSKFWAMQMFQPNKGENVVFYPRRIKTWDAMGAWLGLFPSRGQARKAGLSGLLPHGYSERKIKQKHCMLWLYVPVGPFQ